MRRYLPVTLLVLGCVAALLANLAVWAKTFAFDTESFVDALEPLATDEDVIDAVALQLTDRVMSLQPGDDPQLEALVKGTLNSVLESSAFLEIWTQAARTAHKEFVRFASTSGGDSTLDLDDVLTKVDALITASGRDILSPAQIERIDDVVVKTQGHLDLTLRIIDGIERAAVVLPFVAIALFAAALLVADDRRRTLARIGWGVAIAMVATVGLVFVARRDVLGLVDDDVYRRAVADVWDAVVHSLFVQTAVVFAVGAVLGLVMWFARRPELPPAGDMAT